MLYKDPAPETENLLSALDSMSTWTKGQFVSWIFRMKLQPKGERHKIWVAMGRRLTKEGMKQFREIYYGLPTPDRRE